MDPTTPVTAPVVPPVVPPGAPMAGIPGYGAQLFNIPPPGFGAPPTTAPVVPPLTSAIPTPSDWSEHKAPDGRVYYYNSVTKQSSWQKPDALKTPAELLLSQCPWKEYTADNGKVYYHNVNTKESIWVIPPELEEIKKKIAAEEAKLPAALPATTPLGIAPATMASLVGAPLTPNPMTPNNVSLPGTPATVFSGPNSPSVASPGQKSALESAMAATLASIDIPVPSSKQDEDSNMSNHSDKRDSQTSTPEPRVFKDKKEAMEAFKDFLKEKNISSNATWDQCVKILSNDPRYESFKKLNERKQVFNAYKTQKQKDDKEEQRLKLKRYKQELEEFLMNSEQMSSNLKYYKCDEMFTHLEVWQRVSDSDRREIYEDVVFALGKREKEEAKAMKKRNMKKLAELLECMTQINYDTTWSEAQVMLLENERFKGDVNLLAMDKEDALIVFEEHIRLLEKEYMEDKERERRRQKRQARKNRDQFLALLDHLHEEGKLTSMSLWVELYPIVSADIRFSAMLGQSGSTPLDLFKFYVEDLKSRFHDEKKIIREILKEKEFDVKVNTTFDQFACIICEDKRSASLDAGNVKLTYNSLLEKAETKEKERVKEETKRIKKLEQGMKNLLKDLNIDFEQSYDEVKAKIENETEFKAIEDEDERMRVYKDFQHEMQEACSHRHFRTKKSKKKKKKNYKSSSSSDSEAEKEKEKEKYKKSKHKSRSESPPSEASSEDYDSKKKKKKKSKKKHKSPSGTPPLQKPSDHDGNSETELEKQRALLLARLKADDSE